MGVIFGYRTPAGTRRIEALYHEIGHALRAHQSGCFVVDELVIGRDLGDSHSRLKRHGTRPPTLHAAVQVSFTGMMASWKFLSLRGDVLPPVGSAEGESTTELVLHLKSLIKWKLGKRTLYFHQLTADNYPNCHVVNRDDISQAMDHIIAIYYTRHSCVPTRAKLIEQYRVQERIARRWVADNWQMIVAIGSQIAENAETTDRYSHRASGEMLQELFMQSPEELLADPHDDCQREIGHLHYELAKVRTAIVELMPEPFYSVLVADVDTISTAGDLYGWRVEMIKRIVAIVRPAAKGGRVLCPLCHKGNQSGRGFQFPEGLRRHLAGDFGMDDCVVAEAAWLLARDDSEERRDATARAERDRDARRRLIETLYIVHPREPPKLLEELHWSHNLRSPDALQEAVLRLMRLGFRVENSHPNCVSYTLKPDPKTSLIVLADPRQAGRLTFKVFDMETIFAERPDMEHWGAQDYLVDEQRYVKHVPVLEEFYILDNWKDARFRERLDHVVALFDGREGGAECVTGAR